MPKNNTVFNKFNRGKIDTSALAREDLEAYPFFAEEMTNWFIGVLGNMSMRPGTDYKCATKNNSKAYSVPFIYSNTDRTRLEFTNGYLRPFYNGQPLSRVAVSTAITNGNFDTDLTSWIDADESGSTSVWATGGYLSLKGNGFNYAIRTQAVTISVGDLNKEHGLRISVSRGKVRIRIGSTSGGAEYLEYNDLAEGEHSIAFTPTGTTIYISLASLTTYASLITSCNIESSGAVEISTPYTEALLPLIRYEQSLDVVYIVVTDIQQRKVERRGNTTWSFVKFLPEDGPFRNINTSRITMTPSAINGDITVTASKDFFKSSHVGSLLKMTSTGQETNATLSGENQFTDHIVVSGTDRTVSVVITGTWVATINVQRSFDEGGTWRDYTTYTANTTSSFSDGLDNQEIWYRIGIKTGNYTSGSAVTTLDYPSGVGTGIVRIVGYTSSTSVSAIVLEQLGNTDATESWYEATWSNYRGYPSSVKIFDGRLCSAGTGRIIHSESDAYEGYSDETEGDSAYFQRLLGRGPTQNVPWMLALQRLIIGGETTEYEEKSSSLNEVITPSNANVKALDRYGSALVGAEEYGDGGVYVDKSGSRVMSVNPLEADYSSYALGDLMKLVPNLCPSGVTYVRLAIQRRPDTRFHCVRSDGKVDIMILDQSEDIKGWCSFETDGYVEDVIVLPSLEEEEVYYTIRRVINENTVRYHEKLAMKSETHGGIINKLSDCQYIYSGVSTTTITGLNHLEGKGVVVWGNSKNLGSYTVTSGSITLSEAVTYAVIGIPYTALYKSTKMLFAQAGGTSISQPKKINQIGMMLKNAYHSGIKSSSDGITYEPLPRYIEEKPISDSKTWDQLETPLYPVDDKWGVDNRIYLRCQSPMPATVLALVVSMTTNDKA